MVDITVDGDRVLFQVEGLHKLWAFKSRLEIPLAHVTAVEINEQQVGKWWHVIVLRLLLRLGRTGWVVFLRTWDSFLLGVSVLTPSH